LHRMWGFMKRFEYSWMLLLSVPVGRARIGFTRQHVSFQSKKRELLVKANTMMLDILSRGAVWG
jgi:hypothetical protein